MQKKRKEKTSKLPQKQPAKEQSPNTQRIDFGLRVVKTDDYAKRHVRQAPACSGSTPV